MLTAVLLGLSLCSAAEPDDAGDEPAAEPDDDEEEPSPEPDERPPRVIQLAPPELLPSALDDLAEAHAAADDPGLANFIAMAKDLAREELRLPFRSTFFVRPRLNLVFVAPDDRLQAGVGIGVAVGQRWWPLARGKVRWSGENQLQFDGIIGRARGWRGGVTAHVGPWLGPIGVRVGARFDAGRLVAGSGALDAAALLGPELIVAADIARVHPWIGAAPQWDLSGKRTAASGFTVGTETVWTAGVAIETAMFWPRLQASVRTTAMGPVTTVGFGLMFRPSLDTKDPDDEDDP